MNPPFFIYPILGALTVAKPLSARELMCEQCEPEPCYTEHLFVERSQIFVHGEFLYWTAETSGLDYVAKMDPTSSRENFLIGDYELADYEYRPGFRASLSYYRCPKYWEITGQYTWFQSCDKRSIIRPVEPDLFLRPTRNIIENGIEVAKSDIRLRYQLGDFYAARVFDPNPHLRIKAFAGLTAAFFDQDWKITYCTPSRVAPINSPGSNGLRNIKQADLDETNVIEKWQFFGGGMRIGVTADWFWGCQFYLTARTTFAALVGSYENEEVRIDLRGDIIENAKYDDRKMVFHTQFLMGPSWQLPCDCWSVEIFGGYEFNLWMNLQQRITSIPNGAMSNSSLGVFYLNDLLGFHGLTVRATLGF